MNFVVIDFMSCTNPEEWGFNLEILEYLVNK